MSYKTENNNVSYLQHRPCWNLWVIVVL